MEVVNLRKIPVIAWLGLIIALIQAGDEIDASR